MVALGHTGGILYLGLQGLGTVISPWEKLEGMAGPLCSVCSYTTMMCYWMNGIKQMDGQFCSNTRFHECDFPWLWHQRVSLAGNMQKCTLTHTWIYDKWRWKMFIPGLKWHRVVVTVSSIIFDRKLFFFWPYELFLLLYVSLFAHLCFQCRRHKAQVLHLQRVFTPLQ